MYKLRHPIDFFTLSVSIEPVIVHSNVASRPIGIETFAIAPIDSFSVGFFDPEIKIEKNLIVLLSYQWCFFY